MRIIININLFKVFPKDETGTTPGWLAKTKAAISIANIIDLIIEVIGL